MFPVGENVLTRMVLVSIKKVGFKLSYNILKLKNYFPCNLILDSEPINSEINKRTKKNLNIERQKETSAQVGYITVKVKSRIFKFSAHILTCFFTKIC